jgi:hypothetical protein
MEAEVVSSQKLKELLISIVRTTFVVLEMEKGVIYNARIPPPTVSPLRMVKRSELPQKSGS